MRQYTGNSRAKGLSILHHTKCRLYKRLVQRKNLKGIIGVACDYEIEKGINSEKISGRGVKLNGSRVKTQGLRLHEYNCIDNNVDWEKIEELM